MSVAKAKHIRMSPRKVRRVIDLIRGRDIKFAKNTLKFLPQAAAKVVEKLLNSAIANATHNDHLNPELLTVTQAYVDQAVTMKRWRPVSKGRAYQILKKSSHITIEVAEGGDSASDLVKKIAKEAKHAQKESTESKDEEVSEGEVSTKSKPTAKKKAEVKTEKKSTKNKTTKNKKEG